MSHGHDHAPPEISSDGLASGALRGLIPYVVSRPVTFGLVVVSGIVQSAAGIASTALGGLLVGTAISGGTGAQVGAVMWWLLAAVAVAVLAAWWQSKIGHDWAFRLLRDLRVRVFDGLERATPGEILGQRTGDLTATAIADVNTTELFFAHTAGDYLGAVLVSISALGVIAAFSPAVALTTALVMIAVAVVPFVLAKRAGEQGRALRAGMGELNAETVDGVQGLRELSIFNQGESFLHRLLESTRAFHRSQRGYAHRSGIEYAVTDLLLGAGLVAVVAVSAQQVSANALAVAYLPVVILLAVASLGPIATVSATARTLGEVRAAAGRMLAIAHYPAQVEDTGTGVIEPGSALRIEFEDVVFRYDENVPDVLRGVRFDVSPGETLALVGRSGAGKTTCTNLLIRFWDPVSGRITLGGRDLRDYSIHALRQQITLVPQDVYLFNTTVRENIRLARPEANDLEIHAAAGLAQAHEFITALPDGYDTLCGERAAQLSGGQRQRIAIARALLNDSPVIVMDEAVSNLDSESEAAVQQAMRIAREGRTTLLVAHRPSTIRSADRVVVLADGEVADIGRHEELLARSPVYRDLLSMQEAEDAQVGLHP